MTATCAVCKADIVRVFVGAVEMWGHATRREPADHHYARPASRSVPTIPAHPRRQPDLGTDQDAAR